MLNNGGEPLRIIVETVPHEVVARLENTDAKLRRELEALRGMFSQSMEVISELRKELRELRSRR